MNRLFRWLLVAGSLLLLPGLSLPAKAQAYEVQQLLLDIEKLAQLKQILKDLEEGYQILDKGYSVIRDLSKGNFDLHKAFLDGLLAVSPAVRNYKHVADILSLQASILTRYKAVWSRCQQDGHFSPEELEGMARIYGNLFDQSVKDLDALAMVLTDGRLRANDAERIKRIEGIYKGMQEKSLFLEQYNAGATQLSLQRAKDEAELKSIRQLYFGLNPDSKD